MERGSVTVRVTGSVVAPEQHTPDLVAAGVQALEGRL